MGACGDLLGLISGELIKVQVVVSHPGVFKVCTSAVELCVAATGLRVAAPLGIMCFSRNLRELMLLVFFTL